MSGEFKVQVRAGIHFFAILTLAFLVLAFGLQPCYANLSPAHPCCPKPVSRCHEKAHADACTMSHPGFTSPEESAVAHEIQGEVQTATAGEALASVTVAIARRSPPLPHVAQFLLNSVLLI